MNEVEELKAKLAAVVEILERTNPSGWRVDPQGMIDAALAAAREQPTPIRDRPCLDCGTMSVNGVCSSCGLGDDR